ncbi:MAG: hypothetical protein ACUVQ3_03850 [bacterium]
MAKTAHNIETEFTLDIYLAEVYYYMAKIKEAFEYFNKADNLVKTMTSKLPEGEPREKFLNKKVFHDYLKLKKELKH